MADPLVILSVTVNTAQPGPGSVTVPLWSDNWTNTLTFHTDILASREGDNQRESERRFKRQQELEKLSALSDQATLIAMISDISYGTINFRSPVTEG